VLGTSGLVPPSHWFHLLSHIHKGASQIP